MTFEKQTQARNNASGPIGEIGQCAVLDLALLAEGLAQENARRRITVGDRLDIHGHKYAKYIVQGKKIKYIYMATLLS